jgi:translation initiation factor IF-2
VQGSVEAVAAALIKLTTPKVKVTIVHAAVGAITEGDVNLAIASKAIIVGFNVRPAGKASQSSEAGGVEIRLYNIIYNAVDDIRSAMEGLLPTTKLEKALGTAEVRQVFKITKVGTIAGCYVTSGLVRRGAEARLVRDSIVVYTGKLSSLRRVKDDVKEVAEGPSAASASRTTRTSRKATSSRPTRSKRSSRSSTEHVRRRPQAQLLDRRVVLPQGQTSGGALLQGPHHREVSRVGGRGR